MSGEGCLICKAPLEYLTQEQEMECAICHKKESSKTRCVNGHYVCSDCHTQGMDSIFGLCLSETSSDPVAIVRRMMDLPFCHMHGPEHHVMVGAALLTAYRISRIRGSSISSTLTPHTLPVMRLRFGFMAGALRKKSP